MEEEIIVRAPGRINIIGEHTDYNDGLVLPASINHYIEVEAKPNDTDDIFFVAENFQETFQAPKTFREPVPGHWVNYSLGVVRLLEEQFGPIPGSIISIRSDIPTGSGLSSSAALTLASAICLLKVLEKRLPEKELLQLCHRAENEFAGVSCGIMDYYASFCGVKSKALFLNCRDLSYELVGLPNSQNYFFVCSHSLVMRSLETSDYNQRRRESELALSAIRKKMPESEWLQFQTDMLTDLKTVITEKTQFKRARHIITENERVKLTVDALKSGAVEEVGKYMLASHESLRDNYEVSSQRLDSMVEIATEIGGALGARMMGGGFGGCTINLVATEDFDLFKEALLKHYYKSDEYVEAIMPMTIVTGARECVEGEA